MNTDNIWFISDTHLNHNKDFVWKERGFNSVQEMNEAIINKWNSVVKPNDIVYHLGDVIMGELEPGLELVRRLNGKIRLAIGNHDTDGRIEAFKNLSNFEDIQFGYRLKHGKKTFLLSHYPALTGNYDTSKTYSIHGHTHSKIFHLNIPGYELMLNVSCDAHDCIPVSFDYIIKYIDSWSKIYNENK